MSTASTLLCATLDAHCAGAMQKGEHTFNHPQFAIPNTLASGSTYGQISNTSVNPRIIQMALKYSF